MYNLIMARGDGTLYKRGDIYYLAYWQSGHQHKVSTGKRRLGDARTWRDKYLGRHNPKETDKVLCGELLDILIEHAERRLRPETAKIYKWTVEAHLREIFGHLRAVSITTSMLKEYRTKRVDAGASSTTCNRELSLLRVAFNLGRKATPPLVQHQIYFPMTKEDNARQGFLTDEQCGKVRDALPDYLKPLFVVACWTGVRKGELLSWTWDQVDFDRGVITLEAAETKSGHARVVPIIDGDMRQWLKWSLDSANGCASVFHNFGEPIKDFRGAWETAVTSAGVPDLKFHDLRRTAVRNMRRAGVPQVVRMRISGHRTDSMERRYNIVDDDDVLMAKALMEKLGKKKD